MRNTPYGLVLFMLFAVLSFASCKEGLPLQHTANCKFKTPEALAQSVALCLRDEDFTCAQHYLPGVGNMLNMKDVNSSDSTDFGTKADHLLVAALKKEIGRLRTVIAEKGGDLTKLKLKEVTQTEKDAILKIVMHLSAGKLDFTMEPVGLFNSEGSWFMLGSRFTTSLD